MLRELRLELFVESKPAGGGELFKLFLDGFPGPGYFFKSAFGDQFGDGLLELGDGAGDLLIGPDFKDIVLLQPEHFGDVGENKGDF